MGHPPHQILIEWRIEKIAEGKKIPLIFGDIPHNFGTTGVSYPSDPPASASGNWFGRRKLKGGPADIRKLTEDDVRDLAEGKAFFILYAKIHYSDEFGVKHWTKFCSFQAIKAGEYHAEWCTAYNGVDRNN